MRKLSTQIYTLELSHQQKNNHRQSIKVSRLDTEELTTSKAMMPTKCSFSNGGEGRSGRSVLLAVSHAGEGAPQRVSQTFGGSLLRGIRPQGDDDTAASQGSQYIDSNTGPHRQHSNDAAWVNSSSMTSYRPPLHKQATISRMADSEFQYKEIKGFNLNIRRRGIFMA